MIQNQIDKGGPVTLTHPEMIRYFMTIKEAAQLVIQSSCLSKGGDLFLLDMGKPVKILELAKQMIYLNGKTIKKYSDSKEGDIEIVFKGLRKGEKLYEELLIDSNSEPTTHERIFCAHEPFLEPEKLFDKLKSLEKYLDQLNAFESIKCLKELVPEWKEHQNI